MNERQAIEAGYHFSGAYSHDKEEMKARAKKERAEGNKAVVVNTPPSKYSRGHRGMGYSVYIIESQANIDKRNAKARAMKVESLKRKIAEAKAEIEKMELELTELTK